MTTAPSCSSRLIAAPPAALYRCWTEPELLKRWFAPEPWSVPEAELDVRAGGASLVVLRGPDGTEFPNRGVYLDVVPNERLVVTDAYVAAWEPSQRPFMTVIVTFAPEGHGTRYIATVRHWTVEGRVQHEAMGFHDGWGRCADQLEAVAKGL